MDSIGNVVKKLSGGNIQNQLEKMTTEILQDKRIQLLFEQEAGLTKEHMERGINELFQYKTQWDNCDQCPGLKDCPNVMSGYQPQVTLYGKDIQLEYRRCALKERDEERKRQESLITSLYIPIEMTKATFKDLHRDNASRSIAIAKALEFVLNVKPRENGQGLYVHGPFGVGKTYLMGAIANKLADQRVETMFVYAPDFFRELKNGIGDGTYQRKFDEVKKAEVLILDDIGAETMSNWVRDDILGALLQFRMMEKLPTLFTSNYDLAELENHLTYTQRGGVEKMDRLKAKRIMERILYLTEEIDMKGENKRK